MTKPLFFRDRTLADKSVAYDVVRWHYQGGKTKPIILGSLHPTKHANGKLPSELTEKLTDAEKTEVSAFWLANLAAIKAEAEADRQRRSPIRVAWGVEDAVKALEAGLFDEAQIASLTASAALLTKALKKAAKAAKTQPKATQVPAADLSAVPDADLFSQPVMSGNAGVDHAVETAQGVE